MDDISVAIVHTCDLPPPLRSPSRQRSLARAASCNDEANAMYASWKVDQEQNPSNHGPEQHFKYLYSGGQAEEDEAQGFASAAAAAAAVTAVSATLTPKVEDSLAAMSMSGTGDAQQHMDGVHGVPAVDFPLVLSAQLAFHSPESTTRSAAGGASLAAAAAAGDSMDDSSAQRSPRSSLAQSESSEPSSQRGELYPGGPAGSPAAAGLLAPLRRHTASAPINAMLPPIRKAYPSSSGLHSYKSDASFLSSETLLSADAVRRGGEGGTSGPRHEGKVRGGIPRSMSAPGLSIAMLTSSQRYESHSQG